MPCLGTFSSVSLSWSIKLLRVESTKDSLLAFQRNGTGDNRTAITRGFDFERTSNQTGTIIHNPQTHACDVALHVRKGKAIILNLQHQLVRPLTQANGDALSLAMLNRIG